MGTWGSGNFENDGALDYLSEVIDGLSARIDEIVEDDEASALDEAGESELVPTVQIIATICRDTGTTPPERERVENWKTRYLKIFDEQIQDLAPEGGFAEERRAVIVRTFDSLLDAADS